MEKKILCWDERLTEMRSLGEVGICRIWIINDINTVYALQARSCHSGPHFLYYFEERKWKLLQQKTLTKTKIDWHTSTVCCKKECKQTRWNLYSIDEKDDIREVFHQSGREINISDSRGLVAGKGGGCVLLEIIYECKKHRQLYALSKVCIILIEKKCCHGS